MLLYDIVFTVVWDVTLKIVDLGKQIVFLFRKSFFDLVKPCFKVLFRFLIATLVVKCLFS